MRIRTIRVESLIMKVANLNLPSSKAQHHLFLYDSNAIKNVNEHFFDKVRRQTIRVESLILKVANLNLPSFKVQHHLFLYDSKAINNVNELFFDYEFFFFKSRQSN